MKKLVTIFASSLPLTIGILLTINMLRLACQAYMRDDDVFNYIGSGLLGVPLIFVGLAVIDRMQGQD